MHWCNAKQIETEVLFLVQVTFLIDCFVLWLLWLCTCVLYVIWVVLCFRVWIQYRVVIHHCTTRSGIQGGGIRTFTLLILSLCFSTYVFQIVISNKMLSWVLKRGFKWKTCLQGAVSDFSLGFFGSLTPDVWSLIPCAPFFLNCTGKYTPTCLKICN